MKTFAEIIEQVKRLSRDEKEDLHAMLDKILAEERRNEILDNHKQSMKELEKGKVKFYDNPQDLLNKPAKLKPFSKKEYLRLIEKSEEDVRKGRVYAQEEVARYFKAKK